MSAVADRPRVLRREAFDLERVRHHSFVQREDGDVMASSFEAPAKVHGVERGSRKTREAVRGEQ